MDLPHFLLDPLNESITSGTFVDTKFYVFSRRDTSGRVGSPRPLYCNSHVLNTVPYFSTLFSNEFLEGQMRDINDGFPSDSLPYTDSYDYLSDSDLEDDEPQKPQLEDDHNPDVRTLAKSPEIPHPGSQTATKVENYRIPANNTFVRTGKVAVIRDMAAVTFEAMIYFLYTEKVTFAPFGLDLDRNLPAEARIGDWNSAKPPSPSAKSIYRLADKYDMSTLKERAKEHIHANLARCDIIDEVFSGFSSCFPEILSLQVSQLVDKMKRESTGSTESKTRRQLLDKIATLSQSQLARATDALSMIWDGAMGPLDSPAPKPKPNLLANITPNMNLDRLELALLKSISSGAFIDVQFYAYNAIGNGSPLDPKPLFTSSIVIEEWGSAIATQTAGIDSHAVCLTDGLTDDYEHWDTELPDTPQNDPISKCRTETSTSADGREAVILISGAWKTWISLFSYAYTKKIVFSPLRTESGPVVDVGAQFPQLCSPRSMYSLATTLGIENIKECALKDLRSKLTASNIVQELFTSFATSHSTIMEMELEFFDRNCAEQKPNLMDHIQRMASGKVSFFPTTLSLIYDKLFRKAYGQPVTSGSALGKSPETGNPPSAVVFTELLKCPICSGRATLRDLRGLCCPVCPPRGGIFPPRPVMRCPLCDTERGTRLSSCSKSSCGVKFMYDADLNIRCYICAHNNWCGCEVRLD